MIAAVMFGLASKGWSVCTKDQRAEYKQLFDANPADPRLNEIAWSLPRPDVTYPLAQQGEEEEEEEMAAVQSGGEVEPDEEDESAVIGAMRSGLLPILINLV